MEWNNGAISVLFFVAFLMFIIPVALIYLLLKLLIKYSSFEDILNKKEKKDRIVVEIGLVIVAIGFTIGLLSFLNYLNNGEGLLG